MNTDEKKQNDEGNEDPSCCGPEERKHCCPENDEAASGHCDCGEKSDGMGKCFSKCRYFPLVPIVLGTAFLLLGYFLSPAVTRLLWMTGAGLVVGIGLFGLIAINRMAGKLATSHC